MCYVTKHFNKTDELLSRDPPPKLFSIPGVLVFRPDTEARGEFEKDRPGDVTISDPNPNSSHNVVAVAVADFGGQAAENCRLQQRGWL